MTLATITEAELCSAFIAALAEPRSRQTKWVAYPETAGFDILLVREADGAQVGVEAKLSLNTKVVAQALPSRSCWLGAQTGPDFRAVLVPAWKCNSDLRQICHHLGVVVIEQRKFPGRDIENFRYGPAYTPDLPQAGLSGYVPDGWHEWGPVSRCEVPEYVPDVQAGASAPVALTLWKIKAIRVAILLEERPVTRADFRHFQLSPTNWMGPGGWLTRADGGWVAGPRLPDFKAQHPRNWDEIAADKQRWAPPVLKPQEQSA